MRKNQNMKSHIAVCAALALALPASACVAPTGPVEVTRFHLPDTSQLARGAIQVVPAPGDDGQSLEFRTYAAAVSRELAQLGYVEGAGAAGGQIAELSLRKDFLQPVREGGPVSVGVGGSTGSYGSGVGVGIGLNLSGPPKGEVETRMEVRIRERATNEVLWEGRAAFSAREGSPLADSDLGAAKMAEALFAGFPGESGETILVR